MDNITSPYLILHRNMRSGNWNSDAIMRAIMVDEHLAKNVAARQKAWEIIGERLDFSIDTSQSGISLAIDCIGNKDLLYADEKLRLICHRADDAFSPGRRRAFSMPHATDAWWYRLSSAVRSVR